MKSRPLQLVLDRLSSDIAAPARVRTLSVLSTTSNDLGRFKLRPKFSPHSAGSSLIGRHIAAESRWLGVCDRPSRTLCRRARSCADDDRRSPLQGAWRTPPHSSAPAQPEAGHTGRNRRATHCHRDNQARKGRRGIPTRQDRRVGPTGEDRLSRPARKGRRGIPTRQDRRCTHDR
jgi:hypothetical protein